MEEMINKIKEIINSRYSSRKCGWTSQRSEGNYDDCFDDGASYGESWLAHEIGCILGMELEEPEEPDYDY
jgi:hypothetical protein